MSYLCKHTVIICLHSSSFFFALKSDLELSSPPASVPRMHHPPCEYGEKVIAGAAICLAYKSDSLV